MAKRHGQHKFTFCLQNMALCYTYCVIVGGLGCVMLQFSSVEIQYLLQRLINDPKRNEGFFIINFIYDQGRFWSFSQGAMQMKGGLAGRSINRMPFDEPGDNKSCQLQRMTSAMNNQSAMNTPDLLSSQFCPHFTLLTYFSCH